jgi:hypothetical protein
MPVTLQAMAGRAIALVHEFAIARVARAGLGEADGKQQGCDDWR